MLMNAEEFPYVAPLHLSLINPSPLSYSLTPLLVIILIN